MVIGHRKGRQDGASRVFVTKMLRLVIRICFHVTVTDANTPYRLMRSEALDASLELIPGELQSFQCDDFRDLREEAASGALYTHYLPAQAGRG